MNAREADELGGRLAALVKDKQISDAYAILAPVLAERTPFRYLQRIGWAVGRFTTPAVNQFLDRIADEKTEGGWVVIGGTLSEMMGSDLPGVFNRCQGYIIAGDVWYATDILGERVPGPALVTHFQPALDLLVPWREHPNRWVRRTPGIAVHFWAKRSRGEPSLQPQAESLLRFLEPQFTEWEMDVVKGFAWGLKTIGRHYPDTLTNWLVDQVSRPRRVMGSASK
jgi:hypothetical protein